MPAGKTIIHNTIDATDVNCAQVPDRFRAVHFTALPDGKVTPEFAARLKELQHVG